MGRVKRHLGWALLLCGTVCGQELPEAPSSHQFWDRTNRTLFSLHAGLEAVDMGITHHNLKRGGRELNPMGKKLCESGTLGQVVFFGGRTAGVAGISYLLHRLGRHRVERAFLVLSSVDTAYGVAYSFGHR